MDKQKELYNCWLKMGTSLFTASDNVEVIDIMEPGAYTLSKGGTWDKPQIFLHKKIIDTSGLLDIPQPEMEEVMNSIKDFCKKKELFEEWNFIYKRGILMYGAPGTGKTSILAKAIDFICNKMNGIVFILYNSEDVLLYQSFLPNIFRNIEPDRMVLTIFEDVDGMDKIETTLINILDGLGDRGNIINLATTNYTEKMSERLLNRPNRFDRKIEIKSPNADARKYYFENTIKKEKLKNINLEKWIKDTEGFTLAQLGEIVKSVFLLDFEFEEVVAFLKGMKYTKSSHQYNKNDNVPGLGFNLKKNSEVEEKGYTEVAGKLLEVSEKTLQELDQQAQQLGFKI